MIPTIGRIVHYKLSEDDAEAITRRRTLGLEAGNRVREGMIFPMIITRIWEAIDNGGVGGQAFLDGDGILWIKGVPHGDGPGTWSWPPRS